MTENTNEKQSIDGSNGENLSDFFNSKNTNDNDTNNENAVKTNYKAKVEQAQVAAKNIFSEVWEITKRLFNKDPESQISANPSIKALWAIFISGIVASVLFWVSFGFSTSISIDKALGTHVFKQSLPYGELVFLGVVVVLAFYVLDVLMLAFLNKKYAKQSSFAFKQFIPKVVISNIVVTIGLLASSVLLLVFFSKFWIIAIFATIFIMLVSCVFKYLLQYVALRRQIVTDSENKPKAANQYILWGFSLCTSGIVAIIGAIVFLVLKQTTVDMLISSINLYMQDNYKNMFKNFFGN